MQVLKVLKTIINFGRLRFRTLIAFALACAGTAAMAQQADYVYSLRIVNANAPFFTEVSDIETMQPGDKAWIQLQVTSDGGISHGAVQLVGALPSPLLAGSASDSSSSCMFYLYGTQEGEAQYSMGFIQWDGQPSCLMYVPIVWPADVPCSTPRTVTINASKTDIDGPIVANDSVRCGAVAASTAQAVPSTTSFALALLVAMMAAVGVYMRRRV